MNSALDAMVRHAVPGGYDGYGVHARYGGQGYIHTIYQWEIVILV